MTLDEFLKLNMPAGPKLISLFLATRPQEKFTHQQIGEALSIHPANVETAALNLLRQEETPFHPVVVGEPAKFEMPSDHPLRSLLAEALADALTAKPKKKEKKEKKDEVNNG